MKHLLLLFLILTSVQCFSVHAMHKHKKQIQKETAAEEAKRWNKSAQDTQKIITDRTQPAQQYSSFYSEDTTCARNICPGIAILLCCYYGIPPLIEYLKNKDV